MSVSSATTALFIVIVPGRASGRRTTPSQVGTDTSTRERAPSRSFLNLKGEVKSAVYETTFPFSGRYFRVSCRGSEALSHELNPLRKDHLSPAFH